MKRLLIAITLLASLAGHAQNQCGMTPQGIDTFPWSLAQPFPWDSIQGLWQITGQSDVVLQMVVTREDQKKKNLNVVVLSRTQCSQNPLMKGVGIVTAAEKNVVRINLVDQNGVTKLMKLAFFDSRDLQINSDVCGGSVLAASLIDLGSESESEIYSPSKANVMLKKMSASLSFHCRKKKN